MIVGSCSQSCSPITNQVQCTQTDGGNRQGPVCFVGQFGDFSVPVACLAGQICQVRFNLL